MLHKGINIYYCNCNVKIFAPLCSKANQKKFFALEKYKPDYLLLQYKVASIVILLGNMCAKFLLEGCYGGKSALAMTIHIVHGLGST